MRLAALLLVSLIGLGAYVYFLKQAAPEPGAVVTQTISTTGVEMDLMSIAQAERTYFAQNGSYAGLDQLTSSGALTMTRTSRDGYTYSISTSSDNFTVTARHEDASADATNGAAPLHYPAFSIDQTMQVRRSD